MTLEAEHAATLADAEQRLAELQAVHHALWDDRDDPLIASELVTVESGIRAAQQALAAKP